MYELAILMAGHFLADFPLQPEHMLRDKQNALKTSLGTLTLIAHGVIQGLVIGTLSWLLWAPDAFLIGVIVAGSHILIDLGKIRGVYGVMLDQMMHWTVLLAVVVYLL